MPLGTFCSKANIQPFFSRKYNNSFGIDFLKFRAVFCQQECARLRQEDFNDLEFTV